MDRICVYTINTGMYEASIRCRGDILDCDMLYVSNNRDMLDRAREMGWVPLYIADATMSNKRLQRSIKARPHHYLPQAYTASIYLDANLRPTFASALHMVENATTDLVCWRHPLRTTVQSEGEAVVEQMLETESNVAELRQQQVAAGFEDDVGLTETNVLIRRNHRALATFGDAWDACIEICRRDQISFDYCRWKCRVSTEMRPYADKPAEHTPHNGNTAHRTV